MRLLRIEYCAAHCTLHTAHYTQVCAFADACDPLVEASVRGDGEEAKKWEEEREKEQQEEKEQEEKEEVVEQESQDDDGVVKKGRGMV